MFEFYSFRSNILILYFLFLFHKDVQYQSPNVYNKGTYSIFIQKEVFFDVGKAINPLELVVRIESTFLTHTCDREKREKR